MLLLINGKFTIEQLYYYPERNHKLCNIISSERYILHIQVLLECCINREIYTLYTGAAGMLYQQRDIYSIYRCCWNVVSTEIYTLYTGAAGMLTHINGKFTMEQLYYYPDRNHKLCNILSSERYILYIQVLLECCINREIYTLYTGAAGMLIHINGKFTIEQLYYYHDRNHKLCNIVSTKRYILYIQVLLEC